MNIPEQDLDNIELQKVFETRILPLLEEYFLMIGRPWRLYSVRNQ